MHPDAYLLAPEVEYNSTHVSYAVDCRNHHEYYERST
jgi:hypothetical protein